MKSENASKELLVHTYFASILADVEISHLFISVVIVKVMRTGG